MHLLVVILVVVFFVPGQADRCATDLVLLVDHSSSITRKNYEEKILPFLTHLTNGLDIDVDGDHVAFIPFSDAQLTKVAFHLNQHQQKEAVLDALMKHRYQAGNTATVTALDLARDHVFKEANGARSSQYKLSVAPTVLIITDGIATDGDAIAAAVRLNAESGAAIFAVGVGPLAKKEYLTPITKSAARVFEVDDYEGLNHELAQVILQSTTKCKHRNGLTRSV